MIRAAMLGLLGLAGLGLAGACSGEDTEGGACAVDADCVGGNECTSFTCEDGACKKHVEAEGKPVYAGYIAGDCKRSQCGPGGTVLQAVDQNDVAVDPNPCIENTCSDTGVSDSAPAMDGASCGPTMNAVCKGGVCTGCSTNKDCVTQNPCYKATCNAAAMTCEYAIDDTMVLSNVDKGDCYTIQCDATGKLKVVTLEDGSPCGSDDSCNPKACQAGACLATTPPPAGTISSLDVMGDCLSQTCDGKGGTTNAVDDADAPPDELKSDCVKPACKDAEVVSVADVGNPCVNGAGVASTCDAAGMCP